MKREDKREYLVTRFTELLSTYKNSSFIYGYDDVSSMHILAIDPPSIYTDEEFENSYSSILDEFEEIYGEAILCLPIGDKSLMILMKSPELIVVPLENFGRRYPVINMSNKDIIYNNCKRSNSTTKSSPNLILENDDYNRPYKVECPNNKDSYALAA